MHEILQLTSDALISLFSLRSLGTSTNLLLVSCYIAVAALIAPVYINLKRYILSYISLNTIFIPIYLLLICLPKREVHEVNSKISYRTKSLANYFLLTMQLFKRESLIFLIIVGVGINGEEVFSSK